MQAERYKSLEDYALEQGAFRAKFIPAGQVVIDERVRLKCQVPVCRDYNKHLMCPPHNYSVEHFKSLCTRYSSALLVQVRSEGFEPNQLTEAEIKLHLIINKVEGKALTDGYYLAAGFIASSCKLCPECVGYHSGEPCRHPYEARPSIESMGVDIFKTSKNAGLDFQFGLSTEVIYTGLLLID
ncbi:hypothetical protein Tfer_2024 [Thermincola ferriacetica]|uniref:Metal-binding protein n=1 Tax=Thermincola ferriacetica TaxID=281456 RepID=A0A0L6W1M9_9FIRM|nr:DUF2284 domain-containing protein [Thermincola ferriacetica]KNZ69386.1 hypothetical protein Tfer_2024 [Thermincola ferriacetica]